MFTLKATIAKLSLPNVLFIRISVYSGFGLDRFIHDSGLFSVLFWHDWFIQDSGLFGVRFRQVSLYMTCYISYLKISSGVGAYSTLKLVSLDILSVTGCSILYLEACSIILSASFAS